ncbi:NAD(P)H-dependent oxidoreductase [Cellvibrio fibrivorans]|uniref:NADPH-quinone reductase n=1 Tax=Cellvibrio fibrivorans TaxID=126350 RepID=A0ABU1UZJ8_9GAMM|nr:NAD(P)H-dependent oxidoreductase [Cellvibrio fibrivorans]MDR7090632.1 putative NADPH-quinone reductase [Cellvibrio fibrivorans]
MKKNIVVIVGHPDSNSYCASLAENYVKVAAEKGHDVKLFKLGDANFDPILHHGHNQRQELEPDLVTIREAILWASHLVFVYPIWWGSIPALLKGFFDRTFLPGYAFSYRKNSVWWDRLLAGRSAHLIVTMDTPPWYYRWIYKMPGHNQMKITILEWCGIKPIKISSFGPLRGSSPEQREKWTQAVIKHARKV